jgi:exopolysaccharide biosynthesis glucuronosyltransferase PssE
VIFVTVGTDGPFDRLIRVVDGWAGETGRSDVFAQIGRTSLRPSHIEYVQFLDPRQFRVRFMTATVVVSHAGMGTILSALHHCKPILVMPRRASFGEQRNEHQLATAKHLRDLRKITVASDETQLLEQLGRLEQLVAKEPIGPYAQPQLLAAISAFIHGGQQA